MHRLRVYMAVLAAACIAGAIVIGGFALGYYTWWTIAVSAVVGAVLAWPAGIWLARRIKKDDPAWDQKKDRPKPV